MAKAGWCKATCFPEPSSASLLGTKKMWPRKTLLEQGKRMGVNPASRKGGRKGESLSTTTWGSELCGWESLRGGLVWYFETLLVFETQRSPRASGVVSSQLGPGRVRSDRQGTAGSRGCVGRLYGGAGISPVSISCCESPGQRGPESCLSLCRAGALVQAQPVEWLLPAEPHQCSCTQPWFPFSSA